MLAADGVVNTRIAERVGVTVVTVRAWRARFAVGAWRVWLSSGRVGVAVIAVETVEAIVHATLA